MRNFPSEVRAFGGFPRPRAWGRRAPGSGLSASRLSCGKTAFGALRIPSPVLLILLLAGLFFTSCQGPRGPQVQTQEVLWSGLRVQVSFTPLQPRLGDRVTLWVKSLDAQPLPAGLKGLGSPAWRSEDSLQAEYHLLVQRIGPFPRASSGVPPLWTVPDPGQGPWRQVSEAFLFYKEDPSPWYWTLGAVGLTLILSGLLVLWLRRPRPLKTLVRLVQGPGPQTWESEPRRFYQAVNRYPQVPKEGLLEGRLQALFSTHPVDAEVYHRDLEALKAWLKEARGV